MPVSRIASRPEHKHYQRINLTIKPTSCQPEMQRDLNGIFGAISKGATYWLSKVPLCVNLKILGSLSFRPQTDLS